MMTVSEETGRAGGRRADVVRLAGELFAQKGYRATTVREIADAAGILSGSLYHHFDSKESIGDEILSAFINDVLADYRAAATGAAAGGGAATPPDVLETIIRSTSSTLSRHRAALAMLQNDWSFFFAQPRFSYLRAALAEIERTWVEQLERGKSLGLFRPDLDARLTYRLLRDVLWMPARWRSADGYSRDQLADALLGLLFDGISCRPA
jgi:TetR/AcrR family transcriptional regulator, cholesterol catabolism regulator